MEDGGAREVAAALDGGYAGEDGGGAGDEGAEGGGGGALEPGLG